MLYGYWVVNIFLNGTHVHSRVNLLHFKGVQLEPCETYMMKLTSCIWDCLLEHSRHITQIGIYFILRNDWHIDFSWNISKIFYWISFFSVQHMVMILNCMVFCLVYYANCTYCKLVHLIGTYIVQGFDQLIWNYKNFSTVLTFIWESASASMKLRMYQGFFYRYRIFFWNFEICTISIFWKDVFIFFFKNCFAYWIVYRFLLILFSF